VELLNISVDYVISSAYGNNMRHFYIAMNKIRGFPGMQSPQPVWRLQLFSQKTVDRMNTCIGWSRYYEAKYGNNYDTSLVWWTKISISIRNR
jgi:hypothetical protein